MSMNLVNWGPCLDTDPPQPRTCGNCASAHFFPDDGFTACMAPAPIAYEDPEILAPWTRPERDATECRSWSLRAEIYDQLTQEVA